MENLTQLESADFFGDNATYTDVDPLKNLAKLRYLRLPMHSDSSGIVFNGDGLAGMESLQELDMEMRIESLEPLRNLKNLRVLSVVKGPAVEGSFQSMEPLSGLTQLESLEIGIRQA